MTSDDHRGRTHRSENLSEGDVIEVTKRYKVIGIERDVVGCHDVLTMEMVDGEPGGYIERWDCGVYGRDGTNVRVVNE